MATVEQTNLVRLLRARDNVLRLAHKWKESVPLTLEGQAADEIERLQRLLDGRDSFLVSIGQFQAFVDQLPKTNN